MPRIELGSHAPKACILPLYYTPPSHADNTILEQVSKPTTRKVLRAQPYGFDYVIAHSITDTHGNVFDLENTGKVRKNFR